MALTLTIIGAGLPLYLGTIAYCLWWLYDRLIYLGGERCAIGFLGSVDKPEDKSGLDAWDTDFSLNLILAPNQYTSSTLISKEDFHSQMANDGIQGDLMAEHRDKIGDYGFKGHYADVDEFTVLAHDVPTFHAEFEGSGIYKIMQAAKGAAALLTGSALFCAIPIFGWGVCIIGAVAAFALFVSGALIAKGSGSAAEPDVLRDGNHSKDIRPGEDILFVRGDWVYDSAHDGWNELHPIKDCQLVASAKFAGQDVIDWADAIAPYMMLTGVWTTLVKMPGERDPDQGDWQAWVEHWCDAISQANSAETVGKRQLAENQWNVHPMIDGCIAGDSAIPAPRPV